MIKEKRQEIINELVNNITSASFMVFCLFEKIPVVEMEKLRKKLKSEKIKVKVVKNKLIENAFKKLGYNVDDEINIFKQPTFVAFTDEKDLNLPQKLNQFIKDYESIKIKGGFFNKSFIDSKKVEFIASIPSKESLIIQLTQILKSPVINLVSTLKGQLIRLVYVLNALCLKSN